MNLLAMEFRKFRRTLITPALLAMPFLPAAMDAVIFRQARLQRDAVWGDVLRNGLTTWFLLLVPLSVSLLVAQLLHPEHSGGWRLLFSAPVPRHRILMAKLGALGLATGMLTAVAMVAVAVNAALLPALGGTPDWAAFAADGSAGLTGAIGVMVLTFYAGLRFHGFVVPLALGMGGMVIGFVGINSRAFGPWWPWTLPTLATQPPAGFSMVMPLLFSALLVAVAGAASLWNIRHRDA